MTIHIRHVDEANVEVTLTPTWLARLFGAKARRGLAYADGGRAWRWKLTRNHVGSAIEREIECTTVEPVPELRVLRCGK